MIPDQAFCIKAPEGPPLEDRFPYYPGRIVIQALIVAEKPSVARRILDALKSFINKMRGVKDPALDSLRRAEKLMEKALDEVKGKNDVRDGVKYRRGNTPSDILSKREFAQFYTKIGEMMQGKQAQFHMSAHSEYILEIGNKLVYTDGNTDAPSISRIEHIDLEDGTDIDAVTQLIYQSEDGDFTYEQARRITESLFGHEVLVRHDYGVHGASEQRAGRGTRRNGREAHGGNQKFALPGVTLPSIQGGLKAQVRTWSNPPEAQQGSQPNQAELEIKQRFRSPAVSSSSRLSWTITWHQ